MAEWLLGVGRLTIVDVGIGMLQGQVTYQDDGDIAERFLTRASGGPRVVAERLLVKAGGILRAETATLSSAVAAKLLQGSAPSGILPVYAVTYERTDAGYPTLRIEFAAANIMPTGSIKQDQEGWTISSIEIRSVGTVLPLVTIL